MNSRGQARPQRRDHAWRTPRFTTRVAIALWIILAIVVWNVAFDRLIVEAGRAYIRVARAAAEGGSYLGVGDWMEAAIRHALWVATALSSAILGLGLTAIVIAVRRARKRILNSEF